MLVRCPKCQTGFNLPIEKVPAKGAKLRCSACAHGFRVRVDAAGELLTGDAAAPSPRPAASVDGDKTQVGGLFRNDPAPDTSRDATPLKRRSRSAVAGYNPFPLAPKASAQRAGETQLFGSGSSEAQEDEHDDQDSADSIELYEDDLAERSESTQLGPQGLTLERDNNATMLSALGRSTTAAEIDIAPPLSALDTGALDLFDDLDLDVSESPAGTSADLSDDFDPFGDAFDAGVDADLDLLRPSTPLSEESSDQISKPSEPEEDAALPGMSAEAFFQGGVRSEYGASDSLVDVDFGADVATFDPGRGVVSQSASTPRPSRAASPTPELDLPDPRVRQSQPRTDERPSPEPQLDRDRRHIPAPRNSAPASRSGSRPVSHGVAPHQIGATSGVRRFFDVLFIALVVIVAFVAFVAVRAGGFLDFKRFGHMLEVAFEGVPFEPRPEWAVVVEAAPVEPPPELPLRLENVRSSELEFGKERVFVISGTLRNYSGAIYQDVKVRAEMVDRGGEVVAEKTVSAGRFLDREKLVKASTPAAVEKLVEEKVDDIGAEGSLPFTVVFTSVPRAALDAGQLDYRVSIVE